MLEKTFMQFLLQHQQKHNRTLNFLILMESIISASKAIQDLYSRAAINKNLDYAGNTNVQGEDVTKIDVMSDDIFLHYLKGSKQVIQVVSEERDKKVSLNPKGRYFVYYDPIDGSSNVKHNLPVGILFGIAKKNLTGKETKRLRYGSEYIASGIFMIPSGNFTFYLNDAGCWRFLKSAGGTYIRPEKVKLPSNKKKFNLAYNVSYLDHFRPELRDWLIKNKGNYGFRYSGSLAGDVHRILTTGGAYIYPGVYGGDKPYPEGKLRLLYECNVVANIIQAAGGMAIDDKGTPILDLKPKHIHQRSSLIVGNKEVVRKIQRVLKG